MIELYNVLFYVISTLMIIAIFLIVFAKKTIYSIIYSIFFFVGAAFLYFMLNAPFNALCQLSVYVVGIALMLMFTVALINEKKERAQKLKFKFYYLFGLLGVILIGLSFYLLLVEDFMEFLLFDVNTQITTTDDLLNSTQIIGNGIFQNFVISFELFSIFLLIALIGIGCCFVENERRKK